jgi:anti-sigma factor RsiW
MSEHISIERLNELLDGLLSAGEAAPLEAHLAACAECRNGHARLSETVRAVSALPREATPPEGAWEGIAARIAGTAPDAADEVEVYRLPTAPSAPGARRVTFSVPQLAAAAAVIAFFSAGLMWMAIGGGPDRPRPVAVEAEQPGGAAARAVAFTDRRYTAVVTELEQVLEGGRSMLAPETVATIEESLATIDAAIADVESALADDPGSDLLRRMLANHQRTRLGVLQRAAAAVQAQT